MEKLAINLNNFSWQLNIALAGAVFAVFSLIYNEYYIYYGLVTFAFGVLGHIFLLFSNWMFMKDGKEGKYYWIAHLFNFILLVPWISVILYFY